MKLMKISGMFLLGVLFVALCGPLAAADWSDGICCDQILIQASAAGDLRFWTIQNRSNAWDASYDLLVVGLTPFNIKSPNSFLPPSGWTWVGDEAEVSLNLRDYCGPSIGPGQSGSFTYQLADHGMFINTDPDAPAEAIQLKVVKVIPYSGNLVGTKKWVEYLPDGCTCAAFDVNPCPVPDASTLVLFTSAGPLFLFGLRKRRKSCLTV